MPMHQPNCKAAERRAIEANRKIWKMLQEEYGLYMGDGLPPFGKLEDPKQHVHEMKELLKKIFVQETCRTF